MFPHVMEPDHKKFKSLTANQLNSTSLLLVTNILCAVPHMLPTLITDIFTVFFFSVGSHVALCVSLVFVFIVTVVTVVPPSFTVTFNMTINVSYTFEGASTVQSDNISNFPARITTHLLCNFSNFTSKTILKCN